MTSPSVRGTNSGASALSCVPMGHFSGVIFVLINVPSAEISTLELSDTDLKNKNTVHNTLQFTASKTQKKALMLIIYMLQQYIV